MTEQANELITLEATRRVQSGKGNARKLRKAGKIPAVLLANKTSTMLEIDPKLISRVWLGGKRCKLKVDSVIQTVVIQELQIDAVRRLATHVDFKAVD
jgi:ribosomal protein L25 (general stress protein Ctc)